MKEYSVYLNGIVGKDFFPEKFSNQIYFSDNAKVYIEYKTVYSIKYQISGIENYKIDNKVHQILPGRYLVVNNDQDIICLSGNSKKAISIFLESDVLRDVFYSCKSSDENLLSNPFGFNDHTPLFFENSYKLDDKQLSNLLLKLSTHFDSSSELKQNFELGIFFKISEALINSQQETLKQMSRLERVKKSTRIELYCRILKAREFIIDNWSKNLSVVQLARFVCMSPYHFHRTFSSAFGITCSQFQRNIKMQKAKDMIAENSYSISQIAEIVGYENIHSFSKAFKKYFGIPPSKIPNYIRE